MNRRTSARVWKADGGYEGVAMLEGPSSVREVREGEEEAYKDHAKKATVEKLVGGIEC